MTAETSTQVLPEETFSTLRRRVFRLLESSRDNPDLTSRCVTGFVIGLIVLNVPWYFILSSIFVPVTIALLYFTLLILTGYKHRRIHTLST